VPLLPRSPAWAAATAVPGRALVPGRPAPPRTSSASRPCRAPPPRRPRPVHAAVPCRRRPRRARSALPPLLVRAAPCKVSNKYSLLGVLFYSDHSVAMYLISFLQNLRSIAACLETAWIHPIISPILYAQLLTTQGLSSPIPSLH